MNRGSSYKTRVYVKKLVVKYILNEFQSLILKMVVFSKLIHLSLKYGF